MNKKDFPVLVVDDDDDVAHAAAILLRANGYKAAVETHPERILNHLKQHTTGLLLLDMNFIGAVSTGNEGLYWLQQVKKSYPDVMVVMITGYGDVELAVKAMKAGAHDFILKPWQNDKLLATVATAQKLHAALAGKPEAENRKSGEAVFSDIIGQNEALEGVLKTVQKVATTDANVLILGENGTGKELIARQLHNLSHRKDKPFVTVDMGALNENLFESELFGYVKGAFTDAREDRAGRFEAANGGTLFLDEIGNLSIAMQAKLLSVLQNRVVYRVGSNKPIEIDIRLVCATNMPLQQMVKERTFRQDLLYRINTVELNLPPLRDRRDDTVILAKYFIEYYCNKYQKPLKRLHPLAIKLIEKYNWPGNVRELQHAVERAIILNDGEELLPGDFLLPLYDYDESADNADFNLEKNEILLIKKVLQKHGGNISKAAQDLGITRAALYRRMEKYGI